MYFNVIHFLFRSTWLQWNIYFMPLWEHFVKISHQTALTCPSSDAVRDTDAVVNDSKHVDVVLHACFQARDCAGGGIAWNPYL